jgi:hypothetical protein
VIGKFQDFVRFAEGSPKVVCERRSLHFQPWIPAFVGMTGFGGFFVIVTPADAGVQM